MFRPLATKDIMILKRHIQNHEWRNGPQVVAQINGWPDPVPILDVREEMHPPGALRLDQQALRLLAGRPLPPITPKRLEVQIAQNPHWHLAQALYFKTED